ncbi:MAG: phosphodiester glycosidase family protein [Chloroflexi bacterium]|nr:phosphodiester glycosidase family protein [Chloroflexota bacterium]
MTQVVASATMTPNVTIYASTLSVPTTTPLPTPMNTWQPIRPGVEFLQRQERVNDMDDWVTLVRIDLATASLRVHYDPEEVRTVREWFDATQADVVINAGFFTEDKKATGLVIADGQSFGRTYKGFGGMFSLRDNEQARAVELQWLARKPYVADPSIAQAIQSFPMLLLDGEIVDGIPDDGSRNRRSFIGINRAGHVILGVCQSPVWTMTDLAQFLATSELLDLSNAVNLDGGASSGLWMRGVSEAVLVNSLEAVPTVITIN